MSVKWYQSSLPNSGGGAISDTELSGSIVNLLFPTILEASPYLNSTIYRKIFVKNEELMAWELPKLWVVYQPTAKGSVAIGLGTATDSNGAAITYSTPSTESGAIQLPTLAPGASTSVWIRRTLPAVVEEFETSAFQLAVKGTFSD